MHSQILRPRALFYITDCTHRSKFLMRALIRKNATINKCIFLFLLHFHQITHIFLMFYHRDRIEGSICLKHIYLEFSDIINKLLSSKYPINMFNITKYLISYNVAYIFRYLVYYIIVIKQKVFHSLCNISKIKKLELPQTFQPKEDILRLQPISTLQIYSM